MDVFPPELLLVIFGKCDKMTLLALSRTSSRFNDIIEADLGLRRTLQSAQSWERTLLKLETFRAPPKD